ncbi:retrovirus-related pol polyprotein from transposon TNT 1-94 [Tanacetum coccineum]
MLIDPVLKTSHSSTEWSGKADEQNLVRKSKSNVGNCKLKKSFWAEAVNTACYVINQSPSTAVDLKTPMEMWTGKLINYSDLHIFGSPVVKGYRLWDPNSHKVVVSRDVVFMEDKIQENEEAAPRHEEGEPSTLQEALNNPDASFWKEAMQKEIEALHKNKTWELVPLQGGRNPIRNKWVYKIKRNSDDQEERYRARLVVKGYAQKEGINFNKKIPLWSLQYTRLHANPCAYFKRFGNNDFIILLLYVDDMLVAGPNKDRINKLKAQLDREFEMKDLGLANKIIEMQIHRDRVSRKYWLSQKSYVKKILQRFNMQDCKPISTPFPTNVKLSSKMSPVGVVSRYMAEPRRKHWEAVKRILRYIKGTSDVALCFGESDVIVKGYVDSDYACDLEGIVVMSTTEAVWLKMLLEELEHEQEKITLFCDYQSALYLARNPTFHSKTKHIRVQYHFVREKVEEGTVDMQKIHTDDNVADYLTKAIMTSLYGVDPHAA